MKRSTIITFLSLMALTNCSINNNVDENTDQVIKIYWHLTNVSGGIAGVDNNFSLNKIIWSFDQETGNLTVNNTNTDNLEDGLDTGTYAYSVLEVGSNKFFEIESSEFGGFTTTQTQLVIDQNSTSSGTGADGFIYTFTLVAVLKDPN